MICVGLLSHDLRLLAVLLVFIIHAANAVSWSGFDVTRGFAMTATKSDSLCALCHNFFFAF